MDVHEFMTGHRQNLFAWEVLAESDQDLGTLVFVHGLCEHSQRYLPVARWFASRGWNSVGFDHQGHGKSPGRRGCVNRYTGLMDDIGSVINDARDRGRTAPLVLIGHSMGGNLAANYCLRLALEKETSAAEDASNSQGYVAAVDGLVLSAPMFLPTNPPPRPTILAAWITGNMLPWIRVRSPVRAEQLTHNPVIAQAYRDDPLNHDRVSLYLATQLLAQGRWALDHANALDIPTLLLHGEQDPVTDSAASQSFARRVGENATVKIFPTKYHEMLQDVDANEVLTHLHQWLLGLSAPAYL